MQGLASPVQNVSIPQIDKSQEKDDKTEKSDREKTTIVDESFMRAEDIIGKELNERESEN